MSLLPVGMLPTAMDSGAVRSARDVRTALPADRMCRFAIQVESAMLVHVSITTLHQGRSADHSCHAACQTLAMELATVNQATICQTVRPADSQGRVAVKIAAPVNA